MLWIAGRRASPGAWHRQSTEQIRGASMARGLPTPRAPGSASMAVARASGTSASRGARSRVTVTCTTSPGPLPSSASTSFRHSSMACSPPMRARLPRYSTRSSQVATTGTRLPLPNVSRRSHEKIHEAGGPRCIRTMHRGPPRNGSGQGLALTRPMPCLVLHPSRRCDRHATA